ncbi:Bug family tripartite tricarboxylate transporter substrate binding protein [Elioraea sp.]|uniref:Bug family tripartite tricarboxylate transporter substrate binding protein n=1 Tax=Elioraea sp. TaxID=2185103 RepID=UPI003F6FCADF
MSRMTVGRRAVLATPALVIAAPARAQDGRPLRIVVPFPPGGSVDLVSRIVQPRLAERLGRAVVIENRTGASGMIGSGAVAQSPPDGLTIVWGNIATHGINVSIYERMPYDPVTDFTPVTLACAISFMLVVHPSVPVQTVRELVELSKRPEARLSYGSAGSGSLPHLLTEMLKSATGARLEHIPYRGGGPMLIDLVAGTISAVFADVPSLLPHVRAGAVRALAVAGAERSALLPDLPTVAETYPGVSGTAWHGVFAPARTPPEIIAPLNAALVAVLREPEIRTRLLASGAEPIASTPEELRRFQAAEIAKWRTIARAVGAKAE